MRYSRTAVLLAAALSLAALTSGPSAQAASTLASAYSYSAAAPRVHHPRHRSALVPRAATAQAPEVGDPSCHAETYDLFGVVPGGVHRYMTMCGPR
jgi:hypothetical protein